MLQVVLGIIFILLVLSLFATTLMEIINSVLSLRGKYLMKGLKQMLASSGRTDILDAFLHNHRYKQLTSKFLLTERPPSYISPKSFSSILMNVLANESGGGEKFSQIKDQQLRELLIEFEQEAGFEMNGFKDKIEDWYGEVMDRTKGWFKRNNQMWLIIVGFSIAVVFDADTISIFQNLSNNPEAQFKLAAMANKYFDTPAAIDTVRADSANLMAYRQELKGLIGTNIDALREPLGLGWYAATNPTAPYGWFMKFLGWMITALAISLGAPFWFDLLRKIMNISNSGGLSQQGIIQQIIPMPASMPTPMSESTARVSNPSLNTTTAAISTKGDDNMIKSYG